MFKENFIKICAEKGLSPTAVCVSIGLSSSVFSQWTKHTIPRRTTLIKLADALNVSVDYLLGKEGEEEAPLRMHEGELLNHDKLRHVPLFEGVSAGFGAEALEDVAEYIPLYIESMEEAERTLCIRVEGNSMTPKIEDGDIIQVVKQDTIESGKIGVVLIDGTDALVKQIFIEERGVTLRSYNPFYPDMFFAPSQVDHVKVVGVVKKIIKTL